MPLPIVFIAVAGVTGAVGIGKTAKAIMNRKKAKKLNERANYVIKQANRKHKRFKRNCKKNLEELGLKKAQILSTNIEHFIISFGKLKNINFQDSIGIEEISKLCIDQKELNDLKGMSNFATDIITGVTGGAIGGALTAYGAYSSANWLATASTGTAISKLSGIAAKNATLAYFGGGALSAGGLGVSGGIMILGGLIAGPALAIMGWIVEAKTSKAKDEAYINMAKAEEFATKLSVANSLCGNIIYQCQLFVDLLNRLDTYLDEFVKIMDEAIIEHNADYENFNKQQKNATAGAVSLAKAIKAVLDTPILTKEGNLDMKTNHILQTINPEEIKNAFEMQTEN
ncbi:hypothetical protein B5F77_13045 [Parabacteroides sp. An277]|uniref:hypothetical protein n=1 Tax=Parabacteroides sp. An277 TaxID=1965619 RepID=UPI000B3669FD|nr:hypothetical protein [Parabacteroides sp. An277]OUO50354.1 hypothetical protein B5F77_13045 [Parabacteroides sp. An277]